MSANSRMRAHRGFTLIELMIALVILTMILGIIYATYSSVVDSILDTRAASESLRARQFIQRSFERNLGQASEGWLPGAAYRAYSAPVTDDNPQAGIDRGIMKYPFLGARETTANGAADTLSFVSSSPIIGGAAIPGAVKLCTYKVIEDDSGEDDDEPRYLLNITESRWTSPGLGNEQTFKSPEQASEMVERAGDEIGVKPVNVSVPIYAMELAYFDGKDWQETWDGQQIGRLPWAVRARIKVHSPEGDPYANALSLDPEVDEEVVEMIFSVPVGSGLYDAPPDYARPSDREAT